VFIHTLTSYVIFTPKYKVDTHNNNNDDDDRQFSNNII